MVISANQNFLLKLYKNFKLIIFKIYMKCIVQKLMKICI